MAVGNIRCALFHTAVPPKRHPFATQGSSNFEEHANEQISPEATGGPDQNTLLKQVEAKAPSLLRWVYFVDGNNNHTQKYKHWTNRENNNNNNKEQNVQRREQEEGKRKNEQTSYKIT